MVFTKKRRHAETVVPGRITRRTVGCFHFFIGRLIRVRRDSPCVSSNPTRLSLHGPTTQRHNAENTTPAGGPASPAESARHSPAGSRLLLLSLFHGRVIYKNIFYKSQPVSSFFCSCCCYCCCCWRRFIYFFFWAAVSTWYTFLTLFMFSLRRWGHVKQGPRWLPWRWPRRRGDARM